MATKSAGAACGPIRLYSHPSSPLNAAISGCAFNWSPDRAKRWIILMWEETVSVMYGRDDGRAERNSREKKKRVQVLRRACCVIYFLLWVSGRVSDIERECGTVRCRYGHGVEIPRAHTVIASCPPPGDAYNAYPIPVCVRDTGCPGGRGEVGAERRGTLIEANSSN